jgi:hypothetical protein
MHTRRVVARISARESAPSSLKRLYLVGLNRGGIECFQKASYITPLDANMRLKYLLSREVPELNGPMIWQ